MLIVKRLFTGGFAGCIGMVVEQPGTSCVSGKQLMELCIDSIVPLMRVVVVVAELLVMTDWCWRW